MVSVAGWDIGGANCKAYRLDSVGGAAGVGAAVALSRPLAVWREPERLPGLLREMAAELGPVAAHAVTMTAELCDVFPSKSDGVRFVLQGVRAAFGETPVRVWTTEGRLRPPDEVERRPALGAASNWLATGTVVARSCERALLIDAGTTTTDLTPVEGGRVAAMGRDDPGRLAHGELVYTGMVRTPVCAVTPAVYVGGKEVRLAAELFAVTGDAYLLLGLIDPAEYSGPTPDGRPATPGAARRRLARMLCADADDLGDDALRWLALQVMEAQLAVVARAAVQVLSRMDRPGAVQVIGAGLGGRILARRAAERLGLPFAELAALGLEGGQSAPAAAVAHLLAEEGIPC